MTVEDKRCPERRWRD